MTVAWNAANKGASIVLSAANLTATKPNGGADGDVYADGSIAGGKVAVELTCSFTDGNSDVLVNLWGGSNPLAPDVVIQVGHDGIAASSLGGDPVDTGLPVATGQKRRFKIDSVTGEVFIGNSSSFTAEAAFVMPPGTRWWVGASLGGGAPAVATLNPDYTVGDFVSYNNAPVVAEDSDMANDTITDYTEDGELDIDAGVAELAQDAPGNYTLPAPDAEATSAVQKEIFSSSDYEQTVTGTFNYAGNFSTLTFVKGGMVTLRAIDGVWYVRNLNRGVTIR